MGPAVKAHLVQRAGVPRHRPGHQPAQRLLRRKALRELQAAFLAGLAGRRQSARLSGGDLALVGRGREQPDAAGLRRPDDSSAQMRGLGLGGMSSSPYESTKPLRSDDPQDTLLRALLADS